MRRRRDPRSLAIDCRWLGHGGCGRTTEHLLEGLASLQPDVRIQLWGPRRHSHLAWDGVEWINEMRPPWAAFGQVPPWSLPKADITLFMQQQRPLASIGPTAVFVHDTTQIWYAPSRTASMVRRGYLAASAHLASRVLTVSDWARQQIERDLRVPQSKIRVVTQPVSKRLLCLIQQQYETSALTPPFGLYVGNAMPHKNLGRLLPAFSRSRFVRDGGRLALCGGPFPSGMARFPFVDVVTAPSDEDLAVLYSRAAFVVHPSLAEGFGLPVREASAAGIALAHSAVGPLSDIRGVAIHTFDPERVDDMTRAIDRAAQDGASDSPETRRQVAVERPPQLTCPSLFAESVLAALGLGAVALRPPARKPGLRGAEA